MRRCRWSATKPTTENQTTKNKKAIIRTAKPRVFVGFYRVTIPIAPDAQKVATILAMAEAGFVNQVWTSSDFAIGRSLKKNGGTGLAQSLTIFAPLLVKAGMKKDAAQKLFVDNTQRFLAYVSV